MRQRFKALDPFLSVVMGILIIMGLLTIFSAGRGAGSAQATMWFKQAIWFFMGFAGLTLVANQSPRHIFRSAYVLYAVGILSLFAVLALGKSIGGSQRWLVVGSLTWQPSELAKWLALLLVSYRLGTRPPDQLGFFDILGAVLLVVFPMLLVLKQPDLGMAISFLPILVLIPILKGMKKRWIALGIVGVVAMGYVGWNKVLKPYQKQRVLTFLDPEADIQGAGYQINQSRIAIGAGGFFGQGFTGGSQTQLNFLPVKTTDFVFSVWAEERGFLGVLLALGLFGALLSRILEIGKSARTMTEANFCIGATAILALQLVVNVGMVIGILPNKGMVLPFFSAGGSSTLSYMLGLGVVMAVAYRSKLK